MLWCSGTQNKLLQAKIIWKFKVLNHQFWNRLRRYRNFLLNFSRIKMWNWYFNKWFVNTPDSFYIYLTFHRIFIHVFMFSTLAAANGNSGGSLKCGLNMAMRVSQLTHFHGESVQRMLRMSYWPTCGRVAVPTTRQKTYQRLLLHRHQTPLRYMHFSFKKNKRIQVIHRQRSRKDKWTE